MGATSPSSYPVSEPVAVFHVVGDQPHPRMEYRSRGVPKVVTLPYHEALHARVGKQDIDLRHVEGINEIKLFLIFSEDERPYGDRPLWQAQLLPLAL